VHQQLPFTGFSPQGLGAVTPWGTIWVGRMRWENRNSHACLNITMSATFIVVFSLYKVEYNYSDLANRLRILTC
jgi:hypothetical protein